MKPMLKHKIALLALFITAATTAAAQKESGFKEIFDGKTLNGWKAADPSFWSVEDGAITARITPEHPLKDNLYLIWQGGELADFELKLKHRVFGSKGINCGFQFRSRELPNHDVAGYQVDNNLDTDWLVRLYDEHGRHTLAWRGQRTVFDAAGKAVSSDIPEAKGKPWFRLEDWHEYHQVCSGSRLTLKVDGRLAAEVIDDDPKERDLAGILGLQLHTGPPTTAQFKDLQLKILSPVKLSTAAPKPTSAMPPLCDKTLVVWAAPANLTQKGGSALTIDDGQSHFDGIVFGEIAAQRWMPGSDYYRRTQVNQESWPAETGGSQTFVQLAITYQDRLVTVYRNGRQCAQYTMANPPQEFGPQSVAVIGMRHPDQTDNAHFAGAIDDARIYDQALSAAQIAGLKPDEASEIKPWAWWTFDGQEPRDRTGRFLITQISGGAKVENGKLLLDGQTGSLLCRIEKEVPLPFETPAMPVNPPQTWLTYHLAHPGPSGAIPGDPNPAFYYQGRYHLHYIYNHKDGCAFAHVSSEDMVHWKWHPTTLTPKTTGHGMFSGTGFFTRDGKPAMIYHGQGSGKNQVAYALDDLLEKWSKPAAIEPLTATGEKPAMNHWDPDCWFMDGAYYALSGGSHPKLMKSKDLKQWVYLGELFHGGFPADLGVGKGEDTSCANLFQLGGKWMLLCISHGLGARYYLGDFVGEQYLPSHHALLNWARWDCFAPESLLTKDGRRVMWAWCTPWINGMQKTGRAKNFDNLLNNSLFQQGIQSLPRELSLPEDGRLRIKPLRELEALRYDQHTERDLTVKSGAIRLLDGIQGDALELEVVIASPKAKEFGINLLCDDRGEHGFSISSGAGSATLTVDYIKPPFQLQEHEDLTLRIFIDKSMIEVFANDRQAAVAWHEYPPERVHVSLFAKGGDLAVKKVTAWKMKSIYQGNCVFERP